MAAHLLFDQWVFGSIVNKGTLEKKTFFAEFGLGVKRETFTTEQSQLFVLIGISLHPSILELSYLNCISPALDNHGLIFRACFHSIK